jgi:hypothetical protein
MNEIRTKIGQNEIRFNNTELSSGMYFLEISTMEEKQVVKY